MILSEVEKLCSPYVSRPILAKNSNGGTSMPP
jgi:hypothetical protein